MNPWEPVQISCPYCGESVEITIDSSVGRQQYIEDCHVCCRPIHLTISLNEEGLPTVDPRREDE